MKDFRDYLGDRAASTIESYESDVQQFLKVTGVNPHEIDKEAVEAFKSHMKKRNRAIGTINRKLVSVKKYIEFLNENGAAITVNVKPEKQQRQDYLDEMLDEDDFKAMVKEAEKQNDIRAKALFFTLYYTGARVSEAIQITVDEIESDYILIKGKGSKYRDIYIPDNLKAIWAEYAEIRNSRRPELFIGQRGPINRHGVHRIIKNYARAAGVKEERAHAHSFRHLFCLMLAGKGMPIDDIANLAGHSDVNTTRIYTRKTRKQLRSTLNDFFTDAS